MERGFARQSAWTCVQGRDFAFDADQAAIEQ
jgi:hypothetical protein